ncbi:MAG: sporulation protein YhbH [Niameybacter sp.]|uniref:sporulation protein YhbH n=1 Tax=Niameybacter sp. TaxID=2033640 RepID=UPI002FC6F07C
MAIFKEFQANSRDRSVEDRRRHKELVEKSIKENIGSIIAEESIVGQTKNKKIKIPIKGLKEYYFRYGKNQQGVGSGTGNEQKGKRIPKGDEEGNPDAGNAEGEDIYETEITVDEAIHYLFEDLDLPYLEQKKFKEVESEDSQKKWGIQQKGIPPRLSKKHTMMAKIKREKCLKRAADELNLDLEDTRVPFHEDDLKYFKRKVKMQRDSNAVVVCIMDTSGSMGHTKKYLARSFYFLLYQFLRVKYINVEIVFIAHTTVAKEVTEDDFFHRGESGGTYISSGYEKALEVIQDRYPPDLWNVYAFHCSDGDNWGEDNERAVELANKLCDTCNLFGYGEIKISTYTSTIMNKYVEEVKHPNFSAVKIFKKEDVWKAFVDMLKIEQKANEGGDAS